MKKQIKVLVVCMMLVALGAIQIAAVIGNGQENGSSQNNVLFYASDSSESGITEFYNDVSSKYFILAHSIIANTETFYIVPPGHWINFDNEGNQQGSAPFDSFEALLCPSPTTQIWNVTGVKNVKYGPDPTKPWSTFGNYIKVGDQLITCRYYWLKEYGSYLKCKSGGGTFNISLAGMCITTPQHIGNDPIFCNINHYLNFADCYYGVVEAVNESCIVECDSLVKPAYQTGYKGSSAEAFIPQSLEGPYPPNKPITPDGPASGKPGTSYTYSTLTIDPNGDEVSYMFDWGDGTTSSWLGPYSSGEMINASYTWSKKGTYNVRVKARDASGLESDWSDPLPVAIPRTYTHNSLILKILERFPNLFPILRQILGL